MRKEPDFTLTAADLTLLRGPLVYILWDGRKEPAYVGLSIRGAGRPLDPLHQTIGKLKGHRMEIICCQTAEEAIALEREMIDELRPRRNRRANIRVSVVERGIRAVSGDKWQAFVKINNRFVSRVFPADTPFAAMRDWRRAQQGDAARARLTQHLSCTERANQPALTVSR